jgi:hypothetical protein
MNATAACLLRFRDRVQRQRRLAGRFRAEDLDDAAARQAEPAQREVERRRAGRDTFIDLDAVGQAHDRALAVLTFDLRQGGFDGLGLGRPVHLGDLVLVAVGRFVTRDHR